ncbi:helix-turn-helix domain-containing protein [Microbacterium oxydans]|jgi:transcriptional regulator with XRE-family HTH domain|uniref:helix-turn-helix domain-containing protein n=1 Tax=Microbacterium oxydans TaxID=82380 RepID=UPI00226B8DD5|nr:helix-turn-helix transcriptional regulator [Microbacterium oxydans]WAA65091.1 helix-turn-helix domain-containing protein [Microbacterium oxydans]
MGTELRRMLASEVDGARIHAGVSFLQLADRSGIAPAALADLLDGREDFTVVDLAGIAAAIGVPVTTLLPASTPDDR